MNRLKILLLLLSLWLIVQLFTILRHYESILSLGDVIETGGGGGVVNNNNENNAAILSSSTTSKNSNEKKKLLSFELMIRSTVLVDVISQFYQSVFPSLLAFWNENISSDLMIILDDDRYYPEVFMDNDTVQYITTNSSVFNNVVFKSEKLPNKYWFKLYLTGYDRQQYSTLQSDVHTTKDVMIIMDTDSPFLVIPTREDFIDDTTQKIKLVASNIYGGPGKQHDWSPGCNLLFGNFLIDGMTMLPQVYHRSTLQNFRKYFTSKLKLEYMKFVTQYIENHPSYPGIGRDVDFDIDNFNPLNNNSTQETMDRVILYVLNDPTSDRWSFEDAFMFFAQNFTNKPYSEFALLMNYAYKFEHDKYEWHIDNWNIPSENKPKQHLTGHWKYAKPDVEKYARVSCCHLYFDHLLDTKITILERPHIYKFCKSSLEDYHNLNNFMEDWFKEKNSRPFYSISPQYSDVCKDRQCQNGWRFSSDYNAAKQRYKMMRDMIDPSSNTNNNNNIFSQQSLKTKYRTCWNITQLGLNQVYQYLRLRHRKNLGRVPACGELCHDRHTFSEISGGKY